MILKLITAAPVESASDLSDRLKAKFGLSNLWLSDLSAGLGGDRAVHLSLIEVDKKDRGEGRAEKAMQCLVDWADKNSAIITLTPASDFGASKARLTTWYKGHGFVKNKDYRFSASMIRRPETK